MRDPFYLSLGSELAREHDSLLGTKRLSELDLLRGMGRARVGGLRRHGRAILGLLGLAAVGATAALAVALKLPVVRYAIDNDVVWPSARNDFGRWVDVAAGAPKDIAFTDGSTARLAVGSRARLLRTDRRGASLLIESGSADLRVAGSRWTEYLVGAGPFTVAISTGRVEIAWDRMEEQLNLVVHEGYLVISGCQFGAGRSVVAGNELSAQCTTR